VRRKEGHISGQAGVCIIIGFAGSGESEKREIKNMRGVSLLTKHEEVFQEEMDIPPGGLQAKHGCDKPAMDAEHSTPRGPKFYHPPRRKVLVQCISTPAYDPSTARIGMKMCGVLGRKRSGRSQVRVPYKVIA